MPVTNEHSLYAEFRKQWEEIRDCVGGNAAIKARSTRYLPMLSGQSPEDYERYQKKVKFFGATGRALEGLHGNIFRKAPIFSSVKTDSFSDSLEDVDMLGTNIDQFASDLIWDSLQTNWGGILVDYARGTEAVSRLDAEKQGLRAYMKYYTAEQFINWDYKVINGKMRLALVVVREPYTEPMENDRFSHKQYVKYRVLYLDGDGKYAQEVYDEKVSLEVPSEKIEPKLNGMRLDEIPFYCVPGNIPEKSMLYDLAQLNLQHYQDTADYQNGKHYTSIPTPIAIGLQPEYGDDGKPKPMYIGGTKFLFFPNEAGVSGADVKFLEFSGSGMKALAEGIEHIESQMSILGAHIIAAEKKGVETAEALRIHRMGENGVLAAFTRNISDQITKALKMKGLWDGEKEADMDEFTVAFNTDYDVSEENIQTLSALLTGRASGEIPRISVFMGLKNLQLIPEDWDYDIFLMEIEKDKSLMELPPMQEKDPAQEDPAPDLEEDDPEEDPEEDPAPPDPKKKKQE